jgi:hypothetical protein
MVSTQPARCRRSQCSQRWQARSAASSCADGGKSTFNAEARRRGEIFYRENMEDMEILFLTFMNSMISL